MNRKRMLFYFLTIIVLAWSLYEFTLSYSFLLGLGLFVSAAGIILIASFIASYVALKDNPTIVNLVIEDHPIIPLFFLFFILLPYIIYYFFSPVVGEMLIQLSPTNAIFPIIALIFTFGTILASYALQRNEQRREQQAKFFANLEETVEDEE